MTMTKKEIEQLQQELAWALKQADEAEAALTNADKAYYDKRKLAIQEFDEENLDLVTVLGLAATRYETVKKEFDDLRDKGKVELEDYFPLDGRDPKPADGFAMRMEKAPLYGVSEAAMVKKLAHRGHTLFLKLDEKAIKQFVVANAVKDSDGNGWMMPDYIADWLPEVKVATVLKATISDKVLVADAPDVAPDNTPPGSPF